MTQTRQRNLVVEHSDGTVRVITHDGQGQWVKTEHTTPASKNDGKQQQQQ